MSLKCILQGQQIKPITFTVTLFANNWINNQQIIENNNFIVNKYAYIISPTGDSFLACNNAIVYIDNVVETGKITFHCIEPPSTDLIMNVLKTEVITL